VSRGISDHDFWAERGLFANPPEIPEPISYPEAIITIRPKLPPDYEARALALELAVKAGPHNAMVRALDFYAFLMGPNYQPTEPKDPTDDHE